jgi:hypothetical protein
MNLSEIEQLRIDAGTHGDHELVELCDQAIAGDESAEAACQEILRQFRLAREQD